MSRIHEDNNGVIVNAISKTADGKDVAGHQYQIIVPPGKDTPAQSITINFQDGPVQEFGTNGLTSESLIAILIDRTKVLNGKFACLQNEKCLFNLEQAAHWLEHRTEERLARGVEGQNKI